MYVDQELIEEWYLLFNFARPFRKFAFRNYLWLVTLLLDVLPKYSSFVVVLVPLYPNILPEIKFASLGLLLKITIPQDRKRYEDEEKLSGPEIRSNARALPSQLFFNMSQHSQPSRETLRGSLNHLTRKNRMIFLLPSSLPIKRTLLTGLKTLRRTQHNTHQPLSSIEAWSRST